MSNVSNRLQRTAVFSFALSLFWVCFAEAFSLRIRMRRDVKMAVAATGPHVLGLGVCGVDLLAFVDRYPQPDAKIRTTDFRAQGGGNAGNTLTGLSRIGVRTSILTKVGDDNYGKMISSEMKADNIDTSLVVCKKGNVSPFTYVIIDAEGQTRTCIHTPAEELLEEEIHTKLLDGVSLVHLDSRNTLAAIKLARLARERNIPIMLDAEKDRPHLSELLPLCDFIVTNKVFPREYTNSASTEEGMATLLSQGGARLVVTTLGADGSMAMMEQGNVALLEPSSPASGNLPLEAIRTLYAGQHNGGLFEVTRCSAWPVQASEIVDTTGAGDAFIAGIIYGVIHQLSIPHALNLASFIASEKIKAPGARGGLPYSDAVPAGLLG